MNTSDVFVLSSASEGLPTAVVEAMLLGRSVVGSDIPGIREAVGEDLVALLFPPAHHSALADVLVDVAGDPGRFRVLGKLGQRRAQQGFDPTRQHSRAAAIIADALAAR